VGFCSEPPPADLRRGIEQFNRGEYFEQHETLELLWRAERRDVRYLYQGILQIGVAFYHLRRLNHHGTIYMLTRGPGYLRPFVPACQGVDVVALLEAAATARAEVERLGPDRLAQFDWRLAPRVRMRHGF
jgi:predicted metal-dependent hydrolase